MCAWTAFSFCWLFPRPPIPEPATAQQEVALWLLENHKASLLEAGGDPWGYFCWPTNALILIESIFVCLLESFVNIRPHSLVAALRFCIKHLLPDWEQFRLKYLIIVIMDFFSVFKAVSYQIIPHQEESKEQPTCALAVMLILPQTLQCLLILFHRVNVIQPPTRVVATVYCIHSPVSNTLKREDVCLYCLKVRQRLTEKMCWSLAVTFRSRPTLVYRNMWHEVTVRFTYILWN